MLSPERELIDEILPQLCRFRQVKTHRSTKKDRDLSAEKFAITYCMNRIEHCTNVTESKYHPTGPATVWLNKHELSDNIESTLRQATNSLDLHHYLQHKCKWHDMTIANINWMIAVLQSLSPNQKKTIVKFMHEWLPVNGHPGRATCLSTQTYPICRSHIETQGHFLTCNVHLSKWQIIIRDIVQDYHAKYPHLANILHWALTNCRAHEVSFPTENTTLTEYGRNPHCASLVHAQSKIGWGHILKG
jgi:hypothetical protein